MEKKIYKLEDRLVQFAAGVVNFCQTLPKEVWGAHYAGQLLRSSGSAALHYGEAQKTRTTKEFIYKISILLKKTKETEVALKILACADCGNQGRCNYLIQEAQEIASISAKMILNKGGKTSRLYSLQGKG